MKNDTRPFPFCIYDKNRWSCWTFAVQLSQKTKKLQKKNYFRKKNNKVEERMSETQERKTCTRNQNETSSEKDSKLSIYGVRCWIFVCVLYFSPNDHLLFFFSSLSFISLFSRRSSQANCTFFLLFNRSSRRCNFQTLWFIEHFCFKIKTMNKNGLSTKLKIKCHKTHKTHSIGTTLEKWQQNGMEWNRKKKKKQSHWKQKNWCG